MRLLLLALLALALLHPAQALKYVLNPGKLSLSTVDGSSRLNRDLTNATALDVSNPVQLENDDVIRLSLTLGVDGGKSWGKEHVPHQAFVVMAEQGHGQAASAAAQHAWPIVVKPASGKASWNLRMDRIPAALHNASRPLTLSLLIANFAPSSSQEYEPLSLPIIALTLPGSAAAALTPRDKAEIEQGFRGWPFNRHTFGTPPTETMPSRKVSGIAALVTAVVPWVVLLALLGMVKPSFKSPTTRISLLLACLVGLEALAVKYWVSLTLFELLPLLLGGGLVTLLVGKSALGDLRKRRLATSSK